MRAVHVSSALEDIPVDFFADPDGCWDYDQLGRIAGFDQAWGQLSIGALTEPYGGFPDGAAVVLLASADQCLVALVDCVSGNDVGAEPPTQCWGSAPRGNTEHVPATQQRDVAA
jgi:hypothetical protein